MRTIAASASVLAVLLLAGCASEEPAKPAPAEPKPAAADPVPEPEPPLKPDPLGRKVLEKLPTATQARECARRVRTTLDLDGWELRQWPVRDVQEGVSFEVLFAVRGEEVRLVARADELAVLVGKWRSAADMDEFRALIGREADAGVEITDLLANTNYPEDLEKVVEKTGAHPTVLHQGDGCVAERVVLQDVCGRKRVVRIREIFGPHSYASELAGVLEVLSTADEFAYTPDRFRQEGAKIDTKLRPGGWELWLAPTNPDSMDSPSSSSIFALKDGEVRRIAFMDELAGLAGSIDSAADALELCRIPAQLRGEEHLGFEEDHGWIPGDEWEYMADVQDCPREPTVEAVPGGWAVERLACQYEGAGALVRAVVLRQTFAGGRVRTAVVRVVKTHIPLLRTYQ